MVGRTTVRRMDMMANPPLIATQAWHPIDLPSVIADMLEQIEVVLATDGDDSPVSLRKALQIGSDAIHEQFRLGARASCLLTLRTALIDHILKHLWQRHAELFSELALLAVGGYGRGELHPKSDVDIAILLPESAIEEFDQQPKAKTHSAGPSPLEQVLGEWVTALWDLNLDIGYSVRTVSDCEREARNDITVITNLMEARLLCGNEVLFRDMQQIIQPERMWHSADFFAAKVQEQEERHRRFQTNAYRLEPNIKESQGGLRDFQTIAWVCQRQFGTAGLSALVSHQLLEPHELVSLREGLELLWRIRYLLHHVTGRREDRLLFDHQKDIAHAFGYLDDTDNRSIETLMQHFYRTVMSLQRLNEILLQGIGGIISGVTAASKVVPINSRFQLRNGFLEVTHDEVFLHYPPALLELFLVFSNTSEAQNVRSHTVRLIRTNLLLINERFRSDPVVRNLFLQIFCNTNKLTRTVRLMNRYGVMAAYLPAFNQIVGRMQYDLFHIYTVDEHTIGVIRNLRRLVLPQFADEMPHGSEVARSITRHHVLYLSGLFHDIAKGRNGDHSILGAEDARVFAQEHGLARADAELLEWTVRNHLLMSMTAQRRDIDDPKEQFEFARRCGTIERLNHLYLLTISDIRATNPELWNSFKQSLLQLLYGHTLLILKRGLDKALDVEDVINRRQDATRELLAAELRQDARVDTLWESLGDDYFRQYQAVEIARHTEILLANEDTPGPLVSLRYSSSRGSTEILIYTPDDRALFALITAVMERLQLNILSATINTTAGGFALDTFHVLDVNQMPIGDPMRIDEVRQTLTYELGVPKNLPTLKAQRPARRLKYFSIATEVTFSEDESGLTEVHITAVDRPGILSGIGRVLMEADFNVHAARIATLGERIDDVFLLSNAQGQPLSAEEKNTVSELLHQEL